MDEILGKRDRAGKLIPFSKLKHHYHSDRKSKQDFEGAHKDKAEKVLWDSNTPMRFSFLQIGQYVDSANDDLK